MESLLDTLNDETSVIQFVDELLRLTSSFGLYKGGAGGSFDRCIFLTLYNGEENFQHKTKGYIYNIKKPRYGFFFRYL
jgi:hypothetical protein